MGRDAAGSLEEMEPLVAEAAMEKRLGLARKSESDAQEIARVGAPAPDSSRTDEARGAVFFWVGHLQGVAIREVGRDVTVIGDRNVGASFAELDVVAIVVEAMRDQAGSEFFATSHGCEEHSAPPDEISVRSFYGREVWVVSGWPVEMCGWFFAWAFKRKNISGDDACAALRRGALRFAASRKSGSRSPALQN